MGLLDFNASVVETLSTEAANRLLELWRQICEETGRLPNQEDFPLERLRGLAANTFLIQIDASREGADRFEYRRVGTGIDKLLGLTLTGRRVSELFSGPVIDQLNQMYDAPLATGEPLLIAGRYICAERDWFEAEAVHLPITAPDGITPRILCGLFDRGQRRPRTKPGQL